jgi:hypothetical protein
VVPGRELAESFTPSGDEIEWARSRTDQDERHLLAVRAENLCHLGRCTSLAAGSVPRLVPGQVGGADLAEGAMILGLWA